MLFHFKKQKYGTFLLGFTLVEMIISVAIISIILSVVVWNQSKFSNDLEITNVAYRVAVLVRQAQVFGISVKSAGGGFDSAYGVHFYINQDNPTDPSLGSISLFSDNDLSMTYSDGPETITCTGECFERLILNRGNLISKICEFSGDNISCVPGSGDSKVDSVDILFKRPYPDAFFKIYDSGDGLNIPALNVEGVAVCLLSPQGKEKQVTIYQTGQISIEDICINDSGGGSGPGSFGNGDGSNDDILDGNNGGGNDDKDNDNGSGDDVISL